MRRILLALLPAAGLSLAAVPAFAQGSGQIYVQPAGPDREIGDFNDTVPSGGGVHTAGTTYTPAPSAGDATPFGPVLGAPVALLQAPFNAFGGGGASAPARYHCGVIRDWWGTRYTAVCGP